MLDVQHIYALNTTYPLSHIKSPPTDAHAHTQSHINIHTWPEVGFAALDIFMCGKTNPVTAIPVLEDVFKPKLMEVQTVTRGILTK